MWYQHFLLHRARIPSSEEKERKLYFFFPAGCCSAVPSALGLQHSGCDCPWVTGTSWEGAGPCHPVRHLPSPAAPSEGDVKPNRCCSAAVERKPPLTRAAGRGCLSPEPPCETAAFWREKRAFGKGDGILLGFSSTVSGEAGGCLL